MSRLCGFSLLALMILVQTLNAKPDSTSAIRDDADLFTKGAIKTATEQTDRLRSIYKKDVVIETLAEGPKGQSFQLWAEKRAELQKVEGVYVVITLQPKHLEVVVTEKTRRSGLITAENKKELAKIMLAQLRDGKKDDALLKGIDYLAEALRFNAVPAKTKPMPKADP